MSATENLSVLNAFQTVRPRGTLAPSAIPHQRSRGSAPMPLPGSSRRNMVLDSKGNRSVPLAPRLNGTFAIESGVAAQAAMDRRNAILKGGI